MTRIGSRWTPRVGTRFFRVGFRSAFQSVYDTRPRSGRLDSGGCNRLLTEMIAVCTALLR